MMNGGFLAPSHPTADQCWTEKKKIGDRLARTWNVCGIISGRLLRRCHPTCFITKRAGVNDSESRGDVNQQGQTKQDSPLKIKKRNTAHAQISTFLCVCMCFLIRFLMGTRLERVFSVMNLLGITLPHADIPRLLSALSDNKRYVNVIQRIRQSPVCWKRQFVGQGRTHKDLLYNQESSATYICAQGGKKNLQTYWFLLPDRTETALGLFFFSLLPPFFFLFFKLERLWNLLGF